METKSRYFSLVSDRIFVLTQDLEQVKKNLKKAQIEKNEKEIEIYKLEIKFLTHKIEYLERIQDLPFYIVISELSTDQLREIRSFIGKLGLSTEETRAYLMEKLKLHEIPSLIKHSDVSYLAQIDDFKTIIRLANIQKRNGNYQQQKRDLQRKVDIPIELCYPEMYQVFETSGTTKPLCYHELDYIKKRLFGYEAKLDKIMKNFHANYSAEKIKDIGSHLKNPEKRLSKEFVETHMKMVISRFPEQKATVKYLFQSENRKPIFESLSLKKKRAKEQEFLDCVVECYRKDEVLSFFGINVTDIFSLSEEEVQEILSKIKNSAKIKKEKITSLDDDVRTKQSEILNTANNYGLLQEEAKARFAKLIATKISSFPDAWLHWLWKVPDILEVFMKAHVLAEVENLIECLKDPFPYCKEDELVKQIVYTLEKRS